MDVRDVDEKSFATRVAHVAASELCGLLTFGRAQPVAGWYDPASPAEIVPKDAERAIATLGAFVSARDGIDKGEWLWRQAVELGIVRGDSGGFFRLPLARRRAYALFAAVGRQVAEELRAAQVAEAAAAPAPAAGHGLRREDSIDPELEPLDASIFDARETIAESFGGAPVAKAVSGIPPLSASIELLPADVAVKGAVEAHGGAAAPLTAAPAGDSGALAVGADIDRGARRTDHRFELGAAPSTGSAGPPPPQAGEDPTAPAVLAVAERPVARPQNRGGRPPKGGNRRRR